ncbi:hypothetical protein M3Y98_00013900 [Aphelenchoides besseyi]|nr:hypothetical protein M3Y98_00013900 [Aphelenchoides besseyi]KAI6199183.1 hypothetical protein M3Y96_00599300 [Aphelenchoides besseyi]
MILFWQVTHSQKINKRIDILYLVSGFFIMSTPQGLSDFLTFISPICIIVLFFLCLFSCCSCNAQNDGLENSNDPSAAELGLSITGSAQNCSLNMSNSQLNYVDYDGSTVFTVPFVLSNDRFPPKYEDAIKMASITPRRTSCPTIRSEVPPPFYDTTSQQTNAPDQPPAYWALSRFTSAQTSRPTASGLNPTITTDATRLENTVSETANPSVVSSAEVGLEAQKRLRVGLNAVRHASLSQSLQNSTDRLTTLRPVTSFRSTTTNPTANRVQRPATTMNSQSHSHLPSLPGQVTSTIAEEMEPHELDVESLEKF